ncbi:MAG: DsrE family protein [Flavobacteriaceae bacterium]|jgi:intracellular sulfur oxidation DsrE/DsrF family protein|nr:DsrE family protein [Flavobacteriaceae bacterium]
MENVKHKVVFQLTTDNIDEQNALITYVNNLFKHWGSDVLIHVVVHGPGIGMVRKSKTMVGEGVRYAMQIGVKFFACENTMQTRRIEKTDIVEGVEYVPSGLVAIIEKQEQGWPYIKCNF